jgi:hypothetical protein
MELHLILVGIPAVLVVALATLIWSRKGPHPATYKMAEPWTHPPVLWAATDEAVDSSHGHHASEFSVGGGASGTW